MLDFKINLQLFAEERTEPATPKRRRDAREKGQVAKSRELVTALIILASFLGLKILSTLLYGDLLSTVQQFLSFSKNMDDIYRIDSLMQIYIKCLFVFLKVVGPILLLVALVAFISNYLQVGFMFTIKPLAPNFNKINPIEGFKRIFSKQAAAEFLKSVFKIALIGYIVYDYFMKNYHIIPQLIGMSIQEAVSFIGNIIVNIGIRAGLILLILSVFDYVFQYLEFEKSIKMSKQEIKEEYKQTEGDPLIKGKIREKQRQMALHRMMAEVPKSDVIITNPTHFAVAIRYDAAVSDAPIVLAKGKDLIAQKIKDTAKENNIPIVENKPLAQALYKGVDIGGRIPAELYKAVAEVLAFVYSLKNK